jgi:hypothetical protein
MAYKVDEVSVLDGHSTIGSCGAVDRELLKVEVYWDPRSYLGSWWRGVTRMYLEVLQYTDDGMHWTVSGRVVCSLECKKLFISLCQVLILVKHCFWTRLLNIVEIEMFEIDPYARNRNFTHRVGGC